MRDYNFYKLELQWPLIGTMRPELRLLNLHFFNICRHHPTLKFKPHATDDERYVSGIDGVPLSLCVHFIMVIGCLKAYFRMSRTLKQQYKDLN